MILTVTLNAAIDKVYRIAELQKGEVMRVRECTYTAGGKGLNVSKVAKISGAEVLATGFVGGHAGAFIEEQLDEKEIRHDFAHVKGETRSCVNIIEDNRGKQTEFLEPGFTVGAEDVEKFLDKFSGLLEKADVVTLSGSAPSGCDDSIYARLITLAKDKGIKVILDSSGKLLKNGIEALPTLIKPNCDEIAALTGYRPENQQKLIESALQLHQKGIDYVVISLGAEGALMICADGVYKGSTPDIPVVNTVGCGDSMVAAFAAGFERKYSNSELLRYALAVSTANALTMETGNFNPGDLPGLLEKCKVCKIEQN